MPGPPAANPAWPVRAPRWLAAEQAPEHRHHVDFGAGVLGASWAPAPSLACGVRRLRAAAARALNRQRPAGARRHDVEVLQVLVEIGVDAVDLRQRRLVQLLQDLNLISRSALIVCSASANASTIVAGRERIAIGLEIRLPEQVADAAVQELQLVVAQVLDDARDVARAPPTRPSRACRRASACPTVELREIGLRRDLCRRCGRRRACAAAARTPPAAPAACLAAAHRARRGNICCSSRTSVRLARSISMSPTRSSMAPNEISSR